MISDSEFEEYYEKRVIELENGVEREFSTPLVVLQELVPLYDDFDLTQLRNCFEEDVFPTPLYLEDQPLKVSRKNVFEELVEIAQKALDLDGKEVDDFRALLGENAKGFQEIGEAGGKEEHVDPTEDTTFGSENSRTASKENELETPPSIQDIAKGFSENLDLKEFEKIGGEHAVTLYSAEKESYKEGRKRVFSGDSEISSHGAKEEEGVEKVRERDEEKVRERDEMDEEKVNEISEATEGEESEEGGKEGVLGLILAREEEFVGLRELSSMQMEDILSFDLRVEEKRVERYEFTRFQFEDEAGRRVRRWEKEKEKRVEYENQIREFQALRLEEERGLVWRDYDVAVAESKRMDRGLKESILFNILFYNERGMERGDVESQAYALHVEKQGEAREIEQMEFEDEVSRVITKFLQRSFINRVSVNPYGKCLYTKVFDFPPQKLVNAVQWESSKMDASKRELGEVERVERRRRDTKLGDALGDVCLQVDSIQCLSCNLVVLSVTSLNLTNIFFLTSLPNLKVFDFSRNLVVDVSVLSCLEKLTYINGSSNKICKFPITKLCFLYLSRNQIGNDFVPSPDVEVLDLSYNGLFGFYPKSNATPFLQILNISKNQITSLQNLDLLFLQTLDGSDNSIKRIENSNLPALQTLILHHNRITGFHFQNIQAAGVQTILLNHNRIGLRFLHNTHSETLHSPQWRFKETLQSRNAPVSVSFSCREVGRKCSPDGGKLPVRKPFWLKRMEALQSCRELQRSALSVGILGELSIGWCDGFFALSELDLRNNPVTKKPEYTELILHSQPRSGVLKRLDASNLPLVLWEEVRELEKLVERKGEFFSPHCLHCLFHLLLQKLQSERGGELRNLLAGLRGNQYRTLYKIEALLHNNQRVLLKFLQLGTERGLGTERDFLKAEDFCNGKQDFCSGKQDLKREQVESTGALLSKGGEELCEGEMRDWIDRFLEANRELSVVEVRSIACGLMQRMYRGCKARRFVKRLVVCNREKYLGMKVLEVEKIQTAYRRWKHFTFYRRLKKSTVQIQVWWVKRRKRRKLAWALKFSQFEVDMEEIDLGSSFPSLQVVSPSLSRWVAFLENPCWVQIGICKYNV